jgi:hypothetical protein
MRTEKEVRSILKKYVADFEKSLKSGYVDWHALTMIETMRWILEQEQETATEKRFHEPMRRLNKNRRLAWQTQTTETART